MKSFINKFLDIFRGPRRKESEYYTSQYRRDLCERFSSLVIEDLVIGGFTLHSVMSIASMQREGKLNAMILNEPLSGRAIVKIVSFMKLEIDKNILKKHLSPDKTTLTVKGLIGIYSDMWRTVEDAQRIERATSERIRENEKRDADRKAKLLLENL